MKLGVGDPRPQRCGGMTSGDKTGQNETFAGVNVVAADGSVMTMETITTNKGAK